MIGDRSGVAENEVARHYPCDDFVENPVASAYRGVTVLARPEQVWPWIVQLRLAPYSYDWIDDFGRHSPQDLRNLLDPEVGDPYSATAGKSVGKVLSVTSHEQLTATIMGAVMSYVLVPEATSTRLLLKFVMRRGRLVAPLLVLGDLPMARRQRLNLKELAEQHG